MIGKRIKIVRQYFGLSLEYFGKRIKRSGSQVSKLERGYYYPSETVIKSICSEFHVRPEWLIDEKGDMLDRSVLPADFQTVGIRIRKLRRENKLTQREFGERIQCSLDMVSRVELGKKRPSNRWLLKVSNEFQVPMSWLLTGQNDPFQNAESKSLLLREGQLMKAIMKSDRSYEEILAFLGADDS